MLANLKQQTQHGGNSLNIERLSINTIIIILVLFILCFYMIPTLTRDPRLSFIISLVGGLFYLFIEIIFVKYIDTFQAGGDNAYKYYSNKNYYTGGPHDGSGSIKKTDHVGGNPYRYYDGKVAAGPSF